MFPRDRGSIWEVVGKVHRTVAGAQFACQNVKKLMRSEHFWKCT